MKKIRSAQLGLCLVVLITTSCGFPRLPDLVDAGAADDDDALRLEFIAGDIGGPENADGTGADARFNTPTGVAVDSAGNIYVADTDNQTIRKITTAGVVTTLAGTAGRVGSADGTGAAARFSVPDGVAVDSTGNVYVADGNNHAIRMRGSADGIGAAARFDHPTGVVVDSAGNVYVADPGNSTIRKVTPTGTTTTVGGDGRCDWNPPRRNTPTRVSARSGDRW